MFRRVCLIVTTLVFVAGCSYPKTRVETGGTPPALAILGLDRNDAAILSVDGISYGPAAQYDGVNRVLTLEPGAHHIVVSTGNSVLISEKVMLTGGVVSTVRVR
jgi:hypothetical protein